MSLEFRFDMEGFKPMTILRYRPVVTTRQQADALVNEVYDLKDLGACFDLRAFPLPMRVGPWIESAGLCFTCGGSGLHVYMRIQPRSAHELPSLPRDARGMLELNTCAEVNQGFLTNRGAKPSVERVRKAIRNMVLHEVYEALLFRGERIMNPHDNNLRPDDQPF